MLHGLNDFTAVIKRGAEQAGRDLDVDVEVQGPSSFEATEAIGMFEGMVQKKMDGLVVIPMPGEVWVKPIKEATDAGVPVVTANITSAESGAASWFGQDEYQSGVILATELRKMLEADGKKSGKILAGICKPGVAVLEERYKGFKKGLEGSGYTVTDPKDVGTENTANYSAWENQATANPDAVAAVGLCSMDIPNLAKLKTRTSGKWLIGGYDLNTETLDIHQSGNHADQSGTASLSARLSARSRAGAPFARQNAPAKGWVNVGTEIVTKANVDAIYPRETDQRRGNQMVQGLHGKELRRPERARQALTRHAPVIYPEKIMIDLTGRHIFIAGGSRGIGAACRAHGGAVRRGCFSQLPAQCQRRQRRCVRCGNSGAARVCGAGRHFR